MSNRLRNATYGSVFFSSICAIVVFCFLAFLLVMAIIALGPATAWASVMFLGVPGFFIIPLATWGLVRWMFGTL